MRGLAAILFCAGFVLCANAAMAKPQRIVSINLCADILALTLAGPGTVKSVYRLAADPEDSPVASLARHIPLNNAGAEEILLHRPDLVIAHDYSSPFTLDLLARAHVPVVKVSEAENFQQVRDNISRVATTLGEEEKGARMIEAFDARLAQSARALRQDAPHAIIYQDLGGAAADNTILGAMLRHTGFRNAVEQRSKANFVNLTIEDVIALKPDLVAVGLYRADSPSLARNQLAHPALRAYVDAHARWAELPAHLWTCGSPFVTGIADRLAAARDSMQEGAP